MVSTLSSMKRTSGSTSGFQTSSSPSFRNLIINGDMAVAQRGASFAAVTNTAYMLDRYTYVQGGTTGVITVTQDTDVPNEEFDFSLKVDVTTADAAVAAGDVAAISQYVEAFNTSALQLGTATAATFTLSFWVKSPKTGAHYVTIQNNASDRSYPALYTVSVADTWEKKTITITGDTTGTWVRGTNGIGIKVHFTLICGTNYHGTADTWNAGTDWAASGVVNCFDNTANNFYITGVQLEVGSSATDFEHAPYDYSLRRCCRYYQKYHKTVGPLQRHYYVGVNVSTALADFQVDFVTPMRAAPTFGQSGTASDYNIDAVACASVPTSAQGTSECGAGIRLTATATPLVNKEGAYSTGATSDAYFEFDAEL